MEEIKLLLITLGNKIFILLQSFPFVILIIIFIFRRQISQKIKDISETDISGNKIKFKENAQENSHIDNKETKLDELSTYIKNNPEQAKLEYLKIWEQALYERTFNLIYGTQILLLEKLEKNVPNGIIYENLRIYWLEYCRLGGDKNYTYEKYMEFLKNFLLINYKENNIVLSTGGKGFLNYIRNTYPTIYSLKTY